MMRKIIAALLLAGVILTSASCAANQQEQTTGEYDVTFTEDLSFDALEALFLEKSDSLRFADIPEKYGYVIPMLSIPQLAYPIDENTTFFIMQISENEYSYILSVRASDSEEAGEYTGAEEILAYLKNK